MHLFLYRTHRERKETYIKSLEEQCLQLKELCTESYQGKQAAEEENRKLRELLRMNGIQYNNREQQTGASGYATDPTGVSSSSRSTSAYGFAGRNQQRLSPAQTQGSMMHSPSFGATEYYADQTALSSQSTLNPPSSAVPSLMASQSGLSPAQRPPQQHRRTSQSQQQQQQQQQREPQAGAQQQVPNSFFNDQLAVEFVLESVSQGGSHDLGHTPPPPHHLPSQNFPPFDPSSR